MKILIDITGYMPTWNSRLVKKIWHFRDYLIFQFGGHDSFPVLQSESDTRLTLDFQSEEAAQSAMQAINQAGIGVNAIAV